jgi:hypothetical protein
MHEIRFGTAPLRNADLEALTELLREVRVAAGDFSTDRK